jgi:hypothetical protein
MHCEASKDNCDFSPIPNFIKREEADLKVWRKYTPAMVGGAVTECSCMSSLSECLTIHQMPTVTIKVTSNAKIKERIPKTKERHFG